MSSKKLNNGNLSALLTAIDQVTHRANKFAQSISPRLIAGNVTLIGRCWDVPIMERHTERVIHNLRVTQRDLKFVGAPSHRILHNRLQRLGQNLSKAAAITCLLKAAVAAEESSVAA